MLGQTDVITNEVLEPITFVLAYPTVYINIYIYIYIYIYIVIKYIYIYDELKSYPRLRKPVGSFPWLRVGTGLAVS